MFEHVFLFKRWCLFKNWFYDQDPESKGQSLSIIWVILYEVFHFLIWTQNFGASRHEIHLLSRWQFLAHKNTNYCIIVLCVYNLQLLNVFIVLGEFQHIRTCSRTLTFGRSRGHTLSGEKFNTWIIMNKHDQILLHIVTPTHLNPLKSRIIGCSGFERFALPFGKTVLP